MVGMSRTPSVAARVARRALAPVLAVLVLTALGASPASAHNVLRSTDPADGSTVATAPAQVTLTFDQPAVAIGTEIAVQAPDGRIVSTGEPVLVDSTVSQAITGELPAGTYTVQWRVTSADGHPLSGELAFTATDATAIGVEPAPVETAEPAAEEPSPEVTTFTETEEPAAADTSAAEPDDDGLSTAQAVGIVALVMAVGAGALVALRLRQRRR